MRTRASLLLALLTLTSGLGAQVRRIPPRGGQTPAEPAGMPPEAPGVARALEYRRSRWAIEGYSVISNVQMPVGAAVTSYTTIGAGTRGDYRVTQHFSATADVTVSPFGGASTSETIELGTRFMPLPHSDQVRPFFDARGGFMHIEDRFAPMGTTSIGRNAGQVGGASWYSRGFGAIGGAGLEMYARPSFAVTMEMTAMRNRMTVYRGPTVASVPMGSDFWMTSYRFAFGFKYSPATPAHLAQNPQK